MNRETQCFFDQADQMPGHPSLHANPKGLSRPWFRRSKATAPTMDVWRSNWGRYLEFESNRWRRSSKQRERTRWSCMLHSWKSWQIDGGKHSFWADIIFVVWFHFFVRRLAGRVKLNILADLPYLLSQSHVVYSGFGSLMSSENWTFALGANAVSWCSADRF